MNLTQRSRAQAPAMIWGDNQTTIKWLRNYGHHAKTKHIDTAVLSIREHVIEFKTLDVDYVDTAAQIADALTKSLPPAHHWNLVRFMLGRQAPSQFWKRSSEPEGVATATNRARKMKAHVGLVSIQSGIMSVLASFEGGTDEEKRRRKPFQKFVGELTTVVRELASREIDLEVSARSHMFQVICDMSHIYLTMCQTCWDRNWTSWNR